MIRAMCRNVHELHPSNMAIFVLNLVRDEERKSFRAMCSILGEGIGFDSSMRRFEDEREMAKAFDGAGIQAKRYVSALGMVLCGQQGTVDLDQNEAQKLGVLHTDSSE
jgi:hypothetical protein